MLSTLSGFDLPVTCIHDLGLGYLHSKSYYKAMLVMDQVNYKLEIDFENALASSRIIFASLNWFEGMSFDSEEDRELMTAWLLAREFIPTPKFINPNSGNVIQLFFRSGNIIGDSQIPTTIESRRWRNLPDQCGILIMPDFSLVPWLELDDFDDFSYWSEFPTEPGGIITHTSPADLPTTELPSRVSRYFDGVRTMKEYVENFMEWMYLDNFLWFYFPFLNSRNDRSLASH